MILSLNYNTRQVNTELYCTALRQDLRLHYILDLGCKSSLHSCTLNTDVKTNLPKTLCHDSLIHGWTVTQVILVSLSFPDLLYTPPVSDHMRDSSNIWQYSWWCHWTELYHVLFHSAPLCDLVSGPPLLWGLENTVGPETVHNPTLTVTHQEVGQVYIVILFWRVLNAGGIQANAFTGNLYRIGVTMFWSVYWNIYFAHVH